MKKLFYLLAVLILLLAGCVDDSNGTSAAPETVESALPLQTLLPALAETIIVQTGTSTIPAETLPGQEDVEASSEGTQQGLDDIQDMLDDLKDLSDIDFSE